MARLGQTHLRGPGAASLRVVRSPIHMPVHTCVRFKRLLSMVGRILILPPRPLALLYTSAVILANMSLGTAEEETAYRIKILSQLALRGGSYLGGPESLRWRVFSSPSQMSELKA